jgi:hypothetical protein
MPKIVGYSHWFEVPENAPYAKNMLDSSVAGLLQMDECGVNSEWLKRLTIKHAAKHYNQDVLDKLEKIIQPHYLGVDRVNPRNVSDYTDKTVVFNHRDAGYTGWEWFVKCVDEIWETRQDFKVYTTLAQIDRPWNERVKLTGRNEYMDFLSKMKFGVGTFQTYSAWSISTTDGFSVGCPYLLPNDLCSGWDSVFELKTMQETESLLKIKDFIKDKKVTNKFDILEYMGWGVRVKWSGYRNALREMPEIKFTKGGYEWIGN